MSMKQKLLTDFSLCSQTLGALFYYDPADIRISTLIELFNSSEWLTEWPFADKYDCQRIDQLFQASKQEQETLEDAYQRLFIGPYALPASPWGSVYLDKENVMFGISTLELRAWLRINQINIELEQNEPEDHIGLLFMLAAWIIEHKPQLLRDFLEMHFLPWAYRYFEKMQLESGHAFYESIALLASQTLNYVQLQLELTVASKTLYF